MESAAEFLLDQISSTNIHGIFLTGSFSIEEGSVVFGSGGPLILSDVDLVVVFESLDAFVRYYPRRVELGEACERLLPEARFSGRVEIGMLVPDSMRKLPPSPGVYNMKRHARILHGGPEILDPIPSYEMADISGGEGVILLENRMAPLCAAAVPAPEAEKEDRYTFLYNISKVYTDIAAAATCLSASYLPRYRGRAEYLARSARGDNGGIGIDDDLLGRIERWTRFKLSPSEEALEADGGVLSSPGQIWMEAAADVIAFWKRGAAQLMGIPNERATSHSARALLNWRPPGSTIGHLRSWKIYLSRYELKRRIAIAAGLGARLTRNDPLDIIRQAAILLLEQACENNTSCGVAAPPGRFPHAGGAWRVAAGETYDRWSDFVFGRGVG
jgi:hypothetical protein